MGVSVDTHATAGARRDMLGALGRRVDAFEGAGRGDSSGARGLRRAVRLAWIGRRARPQVSVKHEATVAPCTAFTLRLRAASGPARRGHCRPTRIPVPRDGVDPTDALIGPKSGHVPPTILGPRHDLCVHAGPAYVDATFSMANVHRVVGRRGGSCGRVERCSQPIDHGVVRNPLRRRYLVWTPVGRAATHMPHGCQCRGTLLLPCDAGFLPSRIPSR
mmetsp:Transcript_90916/g.259519  ORF Transcript_90916/g.259519 Transcript_90916/m.259519 type:complete len:218 (+) Transcript_90916:711-1364(+)